ncbi:MAG: hypothetical protein QF539_01795, partial [Luminiphilus sp.]|nr:hypothetical protein [Luminiphilus sp.]
MRLGGIPLPAPGRLGAFVGEYDLQEGHVNGNPAWKQATDKGLWLARGRNGCWMGQTADVLGTESGTLLLPDTLSRAPCEYAV